MAKAKKKPEGKTESERRREQLDEAINRCVDAHGNITTASVIEAARDPASILHGEFEWNPEKQSQIYLEQRARELIREVRVTVEYEELSIPAPAFAPVVVDAKHYYRSTLVIRRSQSEKRRVMAEEMHRIQNQIRRARSLGILFGLQSHFDAALDQMIEAERILTESTEAEEAA